METPQENVQVIETAEVIPAVSFELAIIDEKEPVKLTPELIRQKSKVLTDLKIISIFDEAGYKAVKAATQKAIKTRTAIEKKDKEVIKDIKARHTTELAEVTDYTASLYIACREAQTNLENKIKAIDDEKAIAAKKLADELKEKTEGREQKMYDLGLTFNGQAFVGYGKMFPKESLHTYSDEIYYKLVEELEALHLEQSVTGEIKPGITGGILFPKGQFTDPNAVNVPHMTVGYGNAALHKKEAELYANITSRLYPTAVYEKILADKGIRIVLTKGKVEDPEADAILINDRVAESGVYCQIVKY